MNWKNTLLTVLLISMFLSACKTAKLSENISIEYTDSLSLENGLGKYLINFKKGESFHAPSFVIWLEDANGNYIKTLFITESYATGTFRYANNSTKKWSPVKGKSTQPATLPYWTYKKGKLNNDTYIPTPEFPFTDGYTGATPKQSFNLKTGISVNTPYRVLVEINQPWDWNNYWSNNKINDSRYHNSAQPSLVYAATIDNSSYYPIYLNPIGHGHPSGDNGTLFTNIATITTAKQIFKSISIFKLK